LTQHTTHRPTGIDPNTAGGVRLTSVYTVRNAVHILYDLLSERTPDQSISHKTMPTLAQHRTFVRKIPYRYWYLVGTDEHIVGQIYLSQADEIGVFIFREYKGRGYGTAAVKALLDKHKPARVIANINPKNRASARMFKRLGFKLIQHTYGLER
jgi:RimJ/RimL family protein N-acetyltransferase